MVRATVRFVLREFPWVHAFSLSDCSVVDCGADGRTVPLPALSLCWCGQTWYEKHFGAELRGDREHEVYRAAVKGRLQSSSFKRALPFDEFCTAAGLALDLRPEYDVADTVQEFFEALRTKHLNDDDRPFCAMVTPWAGQFLDRALMGLHHREWIIRDTRLNQADERNAGARVATGAGLNVSACCGVAIRWGRVHIVPDSSHAFPEE
jgi:hypothetical protein